MTTPSHQTGLAVIALFKLVKGVLLLLVGSGLLKFDRSASFECRLPDYSCSGTESGCVAAAQHSRGAVRQSEFCRDVVGGGRWSERMMMC